jgi:hypothetical protein
MDTWKQSRGRGKGLGRGHPAHTGPEWEERARSKDKSASRGRPSGAPGRDPGAWDRAAAAARTRKGSRKASGS